MSETLLMSDFGYALKCSGIELVTCTRKFDAYAAPEVTKNLYGQASDMWSIGVLLYATLAGVMPFCRPCVLCGTVRCPTVDHCGRLACHMGTTLRRATGAQQVQAELRRLSGNKACGALRFSDTRWWPRTDVSTSCQDLLRALLNADPRKRLTAEQALAHPWFSAFSKEVLG
mmetsp:Transcript_35161/g.92074  ORF Transcript_35161/g.92074 Transcript_35161/m.92074 type:complete len:172 (+) Transcript_35161:830-1345(+)